MEHTQLCHEKYTLYSTLNQERIFRLYCLFLIDCYRKCFTETVEEKVKKLLIPCITRVFLSMLFG